MQLLDPEKIKNAKNFGVAALLKDKGSVFYESLFSPQHVGRVTDLISARLKTTHIDEAQLRILLVLGVMQSYSAQMSVKSWNSKSSDYLKEPLVLECGVDDEKCVLGVSFNYSGFIETQLKDLKQKVTSKVAPISSFEGIFQKILQYSTQVIVRVQPDHKRMEILSILSFDPAQMHNGNLAEIPFEVVELPAILDKQTQNVEFVELGDLNYQDLLKDKAPIAKFNPPAPEEILVKAEKIAEDDSLAQALVKGNAPEPDKTETLVKATPEEKRVDTSIGGVTENRKDEVIKVGGGQQESSPEVVTRFVGSKPNENEGKGMNVVRFEGATQEIKQDQTVFRFSSGEQKQEAAPAMTDAQAQLYKQQIENLNKKIQDLEQQLNQKTYRSSQNAFQSDLEIEDDSEENASGDGIGGIFKKVFSFKKEEGGETKPAEGAGAPAANGESKGDDKPEGTSGTDAPPAGVELEQEDDKKLMEMAKVDPKEATKDLTLTIEAGSFDRAIKKFQNEAEALKSSVKSQKMKEWVDGMLSDLLDERAKIKELSKKLGRGIRQRELEFTNKEKAMLEELGRRDETIKNKDKAIVRIKDQLSQATMQVERFKANASSAANAAKAEKKLAHTQGLLAAAKEENEKLEKQLEEVKDQLGRLKMGNVNGGQADNGSQEKLKQAQKSIDDLKKQNSSLMEKLAEADSKFHTLNTKTEEIRKKLETTTKSLASAKDEANSFKEKYQKVSQERDELQKKVKSGGGGAAAA